MKTIWLAVLALCILSVISSELNAANPYFNRAKSICSFTHGIGEDECIEKRMIELENTARMSKKKHFKRAKEICSFTHGIGEDSCIESRISEIERLEGMKGQRFFSQAKKDCSFTQGIGTDDCVERRMRELERIEQLAQSGPSSSTSSMRSKVSQSTPGYCCKICTKGQACGDSCISWSKQCHKPSGCACQ